jgi:small subunit ribosomal protein S6
MPFYQVLCITVHLNFVTTAVPFGFPEPFAQPTTTQMHTKSLVQQVCTHILDAGSIVRHIDSLGPRLLPQRMKRHGQYHTTGE